MAPVDLERFFQQHFPIIRAKCARMLGDTEEAADIAQETFLRLWGSGAASAPIPARVNWIYVTASRLAVDRLRRSALGVEVPLLRPPDRLVSPLENRPDGGSGAEARLLAREGLRRLAARADARTLEVLILTRLDRMTQEEVAAATGLSSRQIRRILTRAEALMAELLEVAR